MARRATVQGEHVLTREGQRSRFVYLIAEGEVAVRVGGNLLATLGAGRFVGEIGLIADRPATATAVLTATADRPARLLVWSQAGLRKRLTKDDLLRSAILAAIGADLAIKIDQNNLMVARPTPVEDPNAEYTPAKLITLPAPVQFRLMRRRRLPETGQDPATASDPSPPEAAWPRSSTAMSTGQSNPSTARGPNNL